jgi:transposase
VRLDVPAGKVEVIVEHRGDACCPKCGKPCPGYDTRPRRWRHLDTCQLQTLLVADVPRVECEEHGVVQAATPWSEPGSRFTVLFERAVIDGRTKESVDAHFSALPARLREGVEVVAMDMWRPYMDTAAKWLPNSRVCLDRFHVARHIGDALNTEREEEHKRLRADGDRTLVGTKYLWLESPSSMRPERRSLLSRLEGILNAVVLKATNAAAESMNAKIQRIKAMACGYRNRERFRNAILFHLGGLDLYPRPASAHTNS